MATREKEARDEIGEDVSVARMLSTGKYRYLLILCNNTKRARVVINELRAELVGSTSGPSSLTLSTSSGEFVQAVSLSSDNRGLNIGTESESLRPDCLIFDDPEAVTKSQLNRYRRDILPGLGDFVVLEGGQK